MLAQTPNLSDPNAIAAWAQKTGINASTSSPAAQWALLGASEDGLQMTGVTSRRNAEGKATIGIRLERFAAVDGPAGASLSEVALFEVDCTRSAFRQSSFAAYRGHNLTNAVAQEGGTDEWIPLADTILSEAGAEACTVSNAPDYTNRAAGIRWMTENNITQQGVTGFDWLLVGFSPEGAMLSLRTLEGNQRSVPRVTMRLERFDPKRWPDGRTSLSETTEYELNCSRRQARVYRTASYGGHNLEGQAVADVSRGEWFAVNDNAMLRSTADDICRAVELRPGFRTSG